MMMLDDGFSYERKPEVKQTWGQYIRNILLFFVLVPCLSVLMIGGILYLIVQSNDGFPIRTIDDAGREFCVDHGGLKTTFTPSRYSTNKENYVILCNDQIMVMKRKR